MTKALEEFIARRRQKRVLDLVGKLEWDSDYDYKADRSRRASDALLTRSGNRWS